MTTSHTESDPLGLTKLDAEILLKTGFNRAHISLSSDRKDFESARIRARTRAWRDAQRTKC